MTGKHNNAGTDDPFSFRVERRELSTVLRMLNNGQSILLIGGRKIGKTVLLQQVRNHFAYEQGKASGVAIALYQDLMSLTRPITAARLFRALGHKVPLAVNPLLERCGFATTCPPAPNSWKSDPSVEFTAYLNDVLEHLDRQIGRVVLIYLLDECEALLGSEETHTLLGNLRSLMGPETDYRVRMVVTGFRSIGEYEDPETGTSPFTNVLLPLPLGLFVEEEFIQLTAPLLTSLPKAVRPRLENLIREVTGGHPCLTQIMCYWLTTEYSVDTFDEACVKAIGTLQNAAFSSWLASFTPADHNLFQRVLDGDDIKHVKPLSVEFLSYCGVLAIKNGLLCAPCGLFNSWYKERLARTTQKQNFEQAANEGGPFISENVRVAKALQTADESAATTELHALVMKGGGVKGLAYVGALQELQKYYVFNWFVGTSAGAIAALLLAIGYTTDELENILVSKNFKEFLDSSLMKLPINLVFKGGLYEARAFTMWLDELIAARIESFEPLKLAELPRRATIYASRRYKRALIFDSNGNNSDKAASFAVRCSMSIPLIFTPQRDQGLRVFDGGMQNNYPVGELLATNPETEFIGLYLGNYYEGMPKEKWLFGEMLSIWTEAVDTDALNTYQEKTVLIDPRPIKTTDFAITSKEKEFLLLAGRAAALRFLFKRAVPDGPTEAEVKKTEERVNELRAEIANLRQKRRRKNWIKWTVLLLIAFSVGVYFLSK